MMRGTNLLIACLAVFVATAGQVQGGVVLDQLNDQRGLQSGFGLGSTGSRADRAQTFTVGVSGILDHIDVELARSIPTTTSPVTMDLLGTTGGFPDATNVIATVVAPSTSIPESSALRAFVTFDFRSFNYTVSPGDILAIAMSARSGSGSDQAYNWFGGDPGGYAGGSTFKNFDGGAWEVGQVPTSDFNFKTFVDNSANPVPEPTSLAIFGLGALGLVAGGVRRRKQKA